MGGTNCLSGTSVPVRLVGVPSKGSQVGAVWSRLMVGLLAFGILIGMGEAPVRAAAFEDGDVVVVATDSLNLRSDAGMDGRIITTLGLGMRLLISEGPRNEDGYVWYRVTVLGDSDLEPLRGWVAQDFIALEGGSGSFETAQGVRVTDGPVNVRRAAGTGESIVGSLAFGHEVPIDAGVADLVVRANGYDWIAIRFGNGISGWVATDFLAPLDYSPNLGSDDGWSTAEGAEVVDGPVNLRAEPSLDGAILGTAATGDSLLRWANSELVSADGHTWIKVKSGALPDPAWIAIDFLAPIADMDCADGACYPRELDPFYGVDAVVVTDGPVNLRANPGTSAAVLAVLDEGEYLTVESVLGPDPYEASGYLWIEVSVGGETGFVAIDYVRPVE